MVNVMRTAGKKGFIAHNPARFAPTIEDYRTRGPLMLAGGLPPANGTIDRISAVADWPMFGNDEYGDCVEAELLHADMAVSGMAGHEVTYAPGYGLTLYSDITGFNQNAGPPGSNPTDQGTDIQTALEYWKNTGLKAADGSIHKLAGYAQFANPADETLLAQVLDVFGCVIAGGSLQQAQEDQFSASEPWDYIPGQPFIGGHGFPLQRRGVGGAGVWQVVTWGAAQHATRRFIWNSLGQGNGEAWAVVTADWLEANGDDIQGLDLQQLLNDLQYVGTVQ